MIAQPAMDTQSGYGGAAASSSSRIFSAISGGVAPARIERIRRSTYWSLEKISVMFVTTRNKFTRCVRTVPITELIVIVFIVMSTWQ